MDPAAGDERIETVLLEERPAPTVERRVAGVARLRRVVVRERRTIEVEVAHEEYRLTVEDDDDHDRDDDRGLPEGSGGVRRVSVVLHEERIEIVRRVVPVERITLVVEPVSSRAELVAEVRREAVDVTVDEGSTA